MDGLFLLTFQGFLRGGTLLRCRMDALHRAVPIVLFCNRKAAEVMEFSIGSSVAIVLTLCNQSFDRCSDRLNQEYSEMFFPKLVDYPVKILEI